eukprot:gene1896-3673_t
MSIGDGHKMDVSKIHGPRQLMSLDFHNPGEYEDLYHVLLLPNTLMFIDYKSLLFVKLICKSLLNKVTEESNNFGYWQAICHSMAIQSGLYLSHMNTANRKYFLEEIWIARGKWSRESSLPSITNFKIQIMARFRPGRRSNNGLALPLHQYLKIKRQQLIGTKNSTSNNGILLGENDPEDYLDPFIHTLMRDPVKLKSSGRIIDRVMALQCIRKDKCDPFNGKRLSEDMLEALPELALQINEWRRMKRNLDNVTMSLDDVKGLLEEGAIDPFVLQALIEAERLGHVASRVVHDINDANRNLHVNDNNSHHNGLFNQMGTNDDDTEILPLPPNFDIENITTLINRNLLSDNNNIDNSEDNSTENSDIECNKDYQEESNSRWRKKFGAAEGNLPRVLDVNREGACVSMSCPGAGIKPFNFFSVFPGNCLQKDVYENGAKDLVAGVLNGFNSCLLCYGQTGAGKTHTMFGPDGALEDHFVSLYEQQQLELGKKIRSASHTTTSATAARISLPESAGLVVRACAELLEGKVQLEDRGIHVALTAQFVEIYNEQVVDLLSGRALDVRRESGELVGADESSVGSMMDVLDILRRGHARKRFAATAMNERSSRSHTVLVIQVTQSRTDCDTLIKSELHLADLAGSERIKKSRAAGGRLQEAVDINSSLLVLGRVITALTESRSHVPYLESKLTILLRRAFGGNSRTAIVVSCRSDDAHGEETLQSLRFGERCGMISNNTRIAAASMSTALRAIDDALTRVDGQLKSLEKRNKEHLDSYKTLKSSFLQLQNKRRELASSCK